MDLVPNSLDIQGSDCARRTKTFFPSVPLPGRNREVDERQAESSPESADDTPGTPLPRLRRRPLSRTVRSPSSEEDVTEEVCKGVPLTRLNREEADERQAESSPEAADDASGTPPPQLQRRQLSRTVRSPSSEEDVTEEVHKGKIGGDKTHKHSREKLLDRQTCANASRKQHVCNVCEKSFSHKCSLYRHIRTHTSERRFKCGVCKSSFLQKHHLDNHIRIHTGERPFKCDVCQKSFSFESALSYHVRIHTGERPYKCGVCESSFPRKEHLDEHIHIHTGERPFKCSVCQKSFSYKRALGRHSHIHTGERPYKCGVCESSFLRKEHLDGHIRTHTNEKPYKCSVCAKSFSQKDSLDAHFHSHRCRTF